MKTGQVYFYDHLIAKRIMIAMDDGNYFDLGRVDVNVKSVYATYSLIAPSILGAWNDE